MANVHTLDVEMAFHIIRAYNLQAFFNDGVVLSGINREMTLAMDDKKHSAHKGFKARVDFHGSLKAQALEIADQWQAYRLG